MNRVFAQITLPGGTTLDNPTGFRFTSIGEVIADAYVLILTITGIVLTLMLIKGGFGFLTSMGDAKKMESARHDITNAIIGFIIVFAAYWIVQALGITFGITEITDVFGP